MEADKANEISEERGEHFLDAVGYLDGTLPKDERETYKLNPSTVRDLSDYQLMPTNGSDASPMVTPTMQQYKEYSAAKTGYEHLNKD